MCLFGGYLLAGAVYRYFMLGVRGIDVCFQLSRYFSFSAKCLVFQNFTCSTVMLDTLKSKGIIILILTRLT